MVFDFSQIRYVTFGLPLRLPTLRAAYRRYSSKGAKLRSATGCP